MQLDLGRILSRTFAITWRNKWLWLLGIVSGGFVGSSFNYTTSRPLGGAGGLRAVEDQARAALHQWLGLALGILAVVALLWIVAFLLNCVATPAAIWAAVHIDAGEPVTLGTAWGHGRAHFGPYLRLALLRVGAAVVLAAAPGILLVAALVRFMNGERLVDVFGLLLGALLLFVVLGFVGLVLGVALVWAERALVLLGLGAIASISTGWRLLTRSFLDTILFGLVMGAIAIGIGIGVGLAALLVSLPGIVLVILTLTDFSGLTIAGIGWVVLFGGATGLLGGAYLGSLVQVAYALACRDLIFLQGLVPSPSPAAASTA